jgi:hypothetical protein
MVSKILGAAPIILPGSFEILLLPGLARPGF